MFAVCLVGGPLHGRTKAFQSDPAPTLVIPLGDGWFSRYRRSSDQPIAALGNADTPLVYVFSERFEGQR